MGGDTGSWTILLHHLPSPFFWYIVNLVVDDQDFFTPSTLDATVYCQFWTATVRGSFLDRILNGGFPLPFMRGDPEKPDTNFARPGNWNRAVSAAVGHTHHYTTAPALMCLRHIIWCLVSFGGLLSVHKVLSSNPTVCSKICVLCNYAESCLDLAPKWVPDPQWNGGGDTAPTSSAVLSMQFAKKWIGRIFVGRSSLHYVFMRSKQGNFNFFF